MLASIQKIISVEPIKGADRIEKAKVLGWDCVVRKGIFKPEDLCIYIEIDTIIPKSLLDETYSGEEKVRLRTVKMKGQISQGLVLPVDVLEKTRPLLQHHYYDITNEDIGEDVTEELDIKKYEKEIPAQLQGLIKGNFPGFLVKTDEVKIQSDPELLNKLKGKPYYITTKLDGTSATYYKLDGKFGVCSRNLELKDGDNIYWEMARKYNIESWLSENKAIQGEIIGNGIQKNRLEIRGHELYIFNIFNIYSGLYLIPFKIGFKKQFEYHNVINNNINFVPIEEYGDNFNYTLEQLLEKAKGNYESGNKKEGIVVRSIDQTISFKVLNNDFLLENRE